jgi:hypothetical protein
MTIVYKAYDTRLETDVAVKVINTWTATEFIRVGPARAGKKRIPILFANEK